MDAVFGHPAERGEKKSGRHQSSLVLVPKNLKEACLSDFHGGGLKMDKGL